ncbi:hypothetical protein NKDENANG_03333 [Candidatus Entotheonellaceae bacterium PAL068K]
MSKIRQVYRISTPVRCQTSSAIGVKGIRRSDVSRDSRRPLHSEELNRFLCGVDLVVEYSSVGSLSPVAFGRLIDCLDNASRPWFLHSPRPDVNWASLQALWTARDYRAKSLGIAPVQYHKSLGAQERQDMLRATRKLGSPEESFMRNGTCWST